MEDFLLIDDLLQEEEKLARQTVRDYVNEVAVPLMPEACERARFPEELIPAIAKMGLLGITLPTEYGCADSNYVTYGLVCQELERGDSGLRSFVSVQNSLCMYPIFRYGSEQQKRKYLPRMARGELIGCFGLTEPDAGSDPASMRARAAKVDGGWILNGSKMWITNAPFADLAVVWAKSGDGVRGFIIEKESKGFTRIEIKQKMSLRASSTGELVMEDCFVPDENFLPGSEKGLACPLSCLTQARYGIAWGAMGAAMACYEIACAYAKERVQFQKPIASFQLVQKDLTSMLNEITKAQLQNLRVGRLMDEGRATHVMVSLCKMNSAREALAISRMARNLLGANGISLEYHVIRHMTNLESVFTYEGTDNIHNLIIGRHITGKSAFD